MENADNLLILEEGFIKDFELGGDRPTTREGMGALPPLPPEKINALRLILRLFL